ASRGNSPLAMRRLRAWLRGTFGWSILKLGLKLGSFDPAHYRRQTARNTDFRKFDDGLRMTLDCSPETADALEARLAAADAFVHWGVFRQEAAQVTCFVPSATQRGHVHFVDGAGGG